ILNELMNILSGAMNLVHCGGYFLNFPIVFKSAGKNQKKIKEKREFLRKTSFRPNRFIYMVVIQKLITTIEIFEFFEKMNKNWLIVYLDPSYLINDYITVKHTFLSTFTNKQCHLLDVELRDTLSKVGGVLKHPHSYTTEKKANLVGISSLFKIKVQ
ncbi:Uncharacterized protein FWK35_00000829, partial [Aphis craccivora]